MSKQNDKKNPDINEPWISNYPPLQAFLAEIKARCDWQVKLPIYGGAIAEQWRAPGSMPFLVVVQGKQHGWDIYTPNAGAGISETLDDVRARIFAKAKS